MVSVNDGNATLKLMLGLPRPSESLSKHLGHLALRTGTRAEAVSLNAERAPAIPERSIGWLRRQLWPLNREGASRVASGRSIEQ